MSGVRTGREREAMRELVSRVFETSDRMDRQEAIGWVVVCQDLDDGEIAGIYGLYDSQWEAMNAAARHQVTSMGPEYDGDPGWKHEAKPLYPKVHEP